MRVLFVISGLGFGGAERQVVLLAKELVHQGHAVCIYTLSNRSVRADEIAGVQVELVLDSKKSRLDLGAVRRLRRHMIGWQADLVHGFLFDGNLYSRLAAAGTGIPVLDSERNDSYAVPFLQLFSYRLTHALSNGVVANTYAGADFARRLHGLRLDDVHVVWNGIDLEEIDRRLSSSPKPALELLPGVGVKRACVVGRFKPQKDLRLALRVVRRLVDADPTWRVVFVGELRPAECLDYAGQVVADCDRLGLQDHVKFAGVRRDIPEIMGSCDVLLVTSAHEGFPNVVLEAMACGLPVASTEYSDIRRILPMTWQVARTRDEAELASAVSRCFSQHDAVAARQRRWVEEHSTTALSAKRLLGVYGSYLARPIAESTRAA